MNKLELVFNQMNFYTYVNENWTEQRDVTGGLWLISTYICNSEKLSHNARVAKAAGLGYARINSILLQLQAGEHLLTFLLISIAQAMM